MTTSPFRFLCCYFLHDMFYAFSIEYFSRYVEVNLYLVSCLYLSQLVGRFARVGPLQLWLQRLKDSLM